MTENKKEMTEKDLKQIADFFFETGMLQRTPRSGFFLLGAGSQTVAEHLHRASVIAFTLAVIAGKDPYRVACMALFHDMGESRISDLNHLNQRYATRDEDKAHGDIYDSIFFGDKLKDLLTEYEERHSEESKLVKDADTLEWMLSLKEQMDIGSVAAKPWIQNAQDRLKTKEAKQIAEIILKSQYNDWWFPKGTLPNK